MYKVIIAEDEHLIRQELVMMIDWQALHLRAAGEAGGSRLHP